ncbi:hypothetical protein CDL15_Pgr017252 [Punica granatum]|uniref:Uncharacterized protein n=1 Tax=Punica granatum TaxID=22663 RepID=A0A218WR71_PUNGR|nr:hypothetical protein CDL15_Pgr017252 [Punica granatum]PKI55662.1 hypothetical protein CRG98_023973 [Punica granatum]
MSRHKNSSSLEVSTSAAGSWKIFEAATVSRGGAGHRKKQQLVAAGLECEIEVESGLETNKSRTKLSANWAWRLRKQRQSVTRGLEHEIAVESGLETTESSVKSS